ncbi:hypothetical protein [Wenxinia saemankumensis]|uniref:FlgN protein n=1 Tax=Wenxinia saemankumensis TaxID=1447782 RepID=A0A1M6G5C7_9RHOB|nr:hypothetical protein [Wenxinia saemankumensis]SHJ05196.1 hypothetical protein SAMN05444417_2694 [Wenxinia saemankumensis]
MSVRPPDPGILRRLAEEERALLRDGEYAGLSRIAAARAALLRSGTGMSPAMLDELRDDLDRTRALLRAAMDGLRDGAARNDARHRAGARLDTYGADGSGRSVSLGVNRLERRA